MKGPTPTSQQLHRSHINKFRVQIGMPKLVYVKRDCMSCEKKFESEGPHNRLCFFCRNKKAEEPEDIGIVQEVAEALEATTTSMLTSLAPLAGYGVIDIPHRRSTVPWFINVD